MFVTAIILVPIVSVALTAVGWVASAPGAGFITPSQVNGVNQAIHVVSTATSTFAGTVGIGTTYPKQVNTNAILTVAGLSSADVIASTTDNTTLSDAIFRVYAPGSSMFIGSHGTNQVTTQYGITVGGYAEIGAINSSFGSSNGLLIGTRTTATPIIFGTNSLERLRIDSTGNVGLGTTTPYGLLSINAPSQTNPYFVIGSSTSQVMSVSPVTGGGSGSLTISTTTLGCASFGTGGLLYSTGVSCGTGSGGGFTQNIGTSSVPTIGQVAYWTTSGATPELLGKEATSSIVSGVGITVANGSTAFVLGAQPSIACNIASTSIFGCLNASDFSKFNSATTTFSTGLTYTGGTNAVTCNTATASVFGCVNASDFSKFNSATTTFTSPLIYTPGTNAVTCQVATASVPGCLAAADFTTFNNKIGAYDAFTHSTLFLPNFATTSKIAIGTTTPYYSFTVASTTGPQLSLSDGTTGIAEWTFRNSGGNFYIATTSILSGIYGTTTVPAITWLANGFEGLGTSTPGSALSIGMVNGINISTTATSTWGSTSQGINITKGCFAIATVCVGGSSGGAGTVTSGLNGQLAYYNVTGSTVVGTSTNPLYVDAIVASSTSISNTFASKIGLGTTTPPSALTIGSTAANLVSLNPQVLLGTSTLVGASAGGTYVGINSPTGFTGNFLDFQNSGGIAFKVSQATSGFGISLLGTTTNSAVPGKLVIATSTTAQITLTSGLGGDFPVDVRGLNGSLFISTSSATTQATTTLAILGFNSGGQILFGNYPTCNGTGNALGVTSGIVTCDALVSDIRLKKDIQPLTNGLEVIDALRPVSFSWKDLSNHNTSDPREQYGFIAQEVEKLIPSAVGDSTDGYKTLDKTIIIPYLVDAIQQLQVGKAVRSVEESWQWGAIVMLVLWNLCITFGKRNRKKDTKIRKTNQ